MKELSKTKKPLTTMIGLLIERPLVADSELAGSAERLERESEVKAIGVKDITMVVMSISCLG